VSRPRVVLLRGHGVTPWELRPWELLADRYDVHVLVTGSNRFDADTLELQTERVRAVRDLLPRGRIGDLAVLAPGDRYLKLEEHLEGADIVHSLELGIPWSGQAATLKERLGYRLVLTAWETIPLLGTYRRSRGRAYRAQTIPAADRFLATTERARACLVVEGAPPERISVCPPGIDVERFRAVVRRPDAIVSAGRLVWEKGHQDVMRAYAAVDAGLVPGSLPPLLVVGSGPEEDKLRSYARELGLESRVDFTSMPYERMPEVFSRAAALVLASLSMPVWEEQFGMVLAEAMAAGVPVVGSTSGAIPEVVGDDGELFTPGDWLGLARILAARPTRVAAAERVARFSIEAAAERLAHEYELVLRT
jgi:glycosyltransferase involved in cell wall biosynthesis